MKISKKRIVLAAVAMIIASPVVHAEETQKQETQKKQIAQTTQNAGSAGQGEHGHVYVMDTIVTEATRTAIDNMKYAGSIGVIHEENLKEETNVIDAIMDIPGVDGGMEAGRQIGKQFQIRGFGYQSEEYVIIQQDGVPRSPSIYSNMISSFRTDSDILKRVEVTKGASSMLHGSGAIGGVVSMQTKDARDWLMPGEQLGGMVGFRYETNHMHSARTAVYGDFDKVPIDFVIYGKTASFGPVRFAGDGSKYKDSAARVKHLFNDELIRTGLLKLGLNLEEHTFKVSAFQYEEKLDTMWQSVWNISTDDEDLFVHGTLKQTDLTFDYKFNPKSPWIDFDFMAYSGRGKYDRGFENYAGISSRKYVNEDNRWGIKAKNNSIFDTWALNHNLLIGVDYQNRKEDALWEDNGVLDTDTFVTMPNQWHDFGIYAQDIIKFNDLELTIGGRFDKFKREVKKADSYVFNDDRISPRVAVAYTLPYNFTLLAGYAESFKAPTPHQSTQNGPINAAYWYVPNPDLKSETAKEYEVGFSFKQDGLFSDDDGLRLKAIYFNGRIEDMITIVERTDLGTPPIIEGRPQPTRYGQYQNVDLAKRNGIEIDAEYRIGDFRIGASYEHLKVYDAKTGLEEIGSFYQMHADKIIGRIQYSPIENLDFGLKISHWLDPKSNPSTYSGVSRTTGPYTYYYVNRDFTLVDLTGRYTLGKTDWLPFLSGIDISFGVKNLFDKRYINANRYMHNDYVGPGRNWFVNLEVKF